MLQKNVRCLYGALLLRIVSVVGAGSQLATALGGCANDTPDDDVRVVVRSFARFRISLEPKLWYMDRNVSLIFYCRGSGGISLRHDFDGEVSLQARRIIVSLIIALWGIADRRWRCEMR